MLAYLTVPWAMNGWRVHIDRETMLKELLLGEQDGFRWGYSEFGLLI